MPIIVHSPHSGRPVKIRDQDIGRAIRDEEGRIFYAVPRSDGKGYYGSLTRQGSAKDEARYVELLEKQERAEEVVHQRMAEAGAVHDATGVGRSSLARRLVFVVILLAILAALGYVAAVVFDVDIQGLIDGDGVTIPQPEGPSLPDPTEPPQLPEPGPPQPSRLGPPERELQAMSALFDQAEPLFTVSDATSSEHSNAHAGSEERSDEAPDHFDADSADGPGPSPPEVRSEPASASPAAAPPTPYHTTLSGLKLRTLRPAPEGAAVATAGSYVLVHYTAKLPGGQVIDTSRIQNPESGIESPESADATLDPERATSDIDSNADSAADPIAFVLWTGQVIRGWDEGIAGMRVGEVRELVIPPHLISSSEFQLAGSEPANSKLDTSNLKLIFEIELVDVLPGVLHTTTRPAPGNPDSPAATAGDTLDIHYRAYLHDADTLFDDSRTRPASQPLRLTLGAREVILGLELGLAGMREGEHRTLIIPPYLGYGQRGVGTVIPPDATLRYEVELIDIVE